MLHGENVGREGEDARPATCGEPRFARGARSAGLVAVMVLVGAAVLLSGCRSKECARMMACCQQVQDVDGVGEACGPRANNVDNPKTCKTILETIGYMFDEKERALPDVCKLDS